MDKDKVADIAAKVAALLAKAEDPAATPAEKQAFANKATEMMIKYELDNITLDAGKGGELPIVLGQFRLYADGDKLIPDERIGLVAIIAENFECKGVIHRMRYGSADVETGKPMEAGTYYECIGYKADFEFVQILYFNLSMHMLTAVVMEKQKDANYQRVFAQAYVSRMSTRLREMYGRVKTWDGTVSESVGLALRSRLQQVQDKFDEKYPPGTLSPLRVQRTRYDHNAHQRGVAAANAADLGGNKVGGGDRGRGQLGSERKGLNR